MKSLLYFIILSFLLVSVFGDEANTTAAFVQGPRNKRLLGGQDAEISLFPYFAAIEFEGRCCCGGSIVSAYSVVTAAHCKFTDSKKYVVRAGSHLNGRGGSVHPVHKFETHAKFYQTEIKGFYNDIAVILVKEPFQFDQTRQPIALFDAGEIIQPDTQAFIVGMGFTQSGTFSDELKSIVVPVVRKTQCNQIGSIPTGTFCAGYLEGMVGACAGDSGGPVVIDGRLAGVVSAGIGCAAPGFPGLNTAVPYFHHWIIRRALN